MSLCWPFILDNSFCHLDRGTEASSIGDVAGLDPRLGRSHLHALPQVRIQRHQP